MILGKLNKYPKAKSGKQCKQLIVGVYMSPPHRQTNICFQDQYVSVLVYVLVEFSDMAWRLAMQTRLYLQTPEWTGLSFHVIL